MTWARIIGLVAVLALVALAQAAVADAPARSPKPLPRPGIGSPVAPPAEPPVSPPVEPPVEPPVNPDNPGQGAAIPLTATVKAAVVSAGLLASPLPRPRPASAAAAVAGSALPQPALPKPAAEQQPQVAFASTSAGAIAPKPRQRRGLFDFLKTSAIQTQPDAAAIVGRAGSVCGVPGIKGKTLPPIAAKLHGCGISEPVEVTSVDGIALTPAATLECSAAVALSTWVHTAVKPVFSGKGGGLEALRVAGSYDCRTRNHMPGARISEHGRGKAIDIAGFILGSGAEVTIQGDYRKGGYAKLLKTVHRAACGPFGTTLGPGSDGLHEDHLHLDTVSYRSGPYCK